MQTQIGSFIEALCNVGSGILTAYLTWQYIVIPWRSLLNWDLMYLTFQQIIALNIAFTIVSIVRSFLWRRFFNKKEIK